MGSRKLKIFLIIVFVVGSIIGGYFAVNQWTKTKNIKDAKEYLVEKYNLEEDQLIVEEYYPARTVDKWSHGIWPNKEKVNVNHYICFNYKGKLINVYEGKDDYLLEDYMLALNEAYANMLELHSDRVLALQSSYSVQDYCMLSSNLMNTEIALKASEKYWPLTLYIEIDDTFSDKEMEALIDLFQSKEMDKQVECVQFISDLSVFKYTVQISEDRDDLPVCCPENQELIDRRVAFLAKGDRTYMSKDYVYYRGYSYIFE